MFSGQLGFTHRALGPVLEAAVRGAGYHTCSAFSDSAALRGAFRRFDVCATLGSLTHLHGHRPRFQCGRARTFLRSCPNNMAAYEWRGKAGKMRSDILDTSPRACKCGELFMCVVTEATYE